MGWRPKCRGGYDGLCRAAGTAASWGLGGDARQPMPPKPMDLSAHLSHPSTLSSLQPQTTSPSCNCWPCLYFLENSEAIPSLPFMTTSHCLLSSWNSAGRVPHPSRTFPGQALPGGRSVASGLSSPMQGVRSQCPPLRGT